MNIKNIIKLFYIVYTVYMLMIIDITNLKFFEIITAVIFMWINYFVFSLGFRTKHKQAKLIRKEIDILDNRNAWLLNRKKKTLLIIAVSSVVFSLLATKFYTGQSPLNIFEKIISGASLYSDYQSHFKIQDIGVFSIIKIPYIMMLLYIKFVLFYSYISFFIIKKHTTSFEKFYIILVSLAYIYFGIGRGTNFETFELMILIMFVTLTKNGNKQIFLNNLKKLIFLFVLGCAMIFVFYNVVGNRGFVFGLKISDDVFYNEKGIISFLFPPLAYIILIVFDYIGFGFFYMSEFINNIWLGSLSNFSLGFIPIGYSLSGKDSIQTIMKNQIDMGSRWTPDSAVIMNNYGYISLLVFCFALGNIANKTLVNKNKVINYLTNLIILFQMISLPIGNFVTASSSTKIIFVFLIIYWLWIILVRVKVKMKS